MALHKFVFSPTGRTAIAAAAVGKRLGVDPVEHDLADRECDLSAVELGRADVCVVAVPCFSGRVPAVAAERLATLEGNRARAVAVVAYGNRGYDDALVELQDVLEAQNLRCVAAVAAVCEHSVFRNIAAQRPSHDDVRQLKGFSLEIGKLLMTDDGTIVLDGVPGNRPYKEIEGKPLQPFAEENCTRCGTCAPLCPVGAIPQARPYETDDETCIGCMRCVETCPHGVRHVGLLARTRVYEKIRGAAALPRASELWLGHHGEPGAAKTRQEEEARSEREETVCP